jgi:hypothetical protein
MKKILYLLAIGLAFMSCDKEASTFESDNFDQSPEERVESASNELRNALTGSEHGWTANYFTKEDEFRGYYMQLEFTEDGFVRILGEYNETTDTSTYKTYHDNDLELSFDSWNDNLTPLMEPRSSAARGNYGDIEFFYRGIHNEGAEIHFEGKINKSKLVLKKSTIENKDFDRILHVRNAFQNFTNSFEKEFVSFNAEGLTTPGIGYDFNDRQAPDQLMFSYNVGDELIRDKRAYGVTKDGIILSSPVEFFGKKLEFLKYKGDFADDTNVDPKELFEWESDTKISFTSTSFLEYFVPRGFEFFSSAFPRLARRHRGVFVPLLDAAINSSPGLRNTYFMFNGYLGVSQWFNIDGEWVELEKNVDTKEGFAFEVRGYESRGYVIFTTDYREIAPDRIGFDLTGNGTYEYFIANAVIDNPTTPEDEHALMQVELEAKAEELKNSVEVQNLLDQIGNEQGYWIYSKGRTWELRSIENSDNVLEVIPRLGG